MGTQHPFALLNIERELSEEQKAMQSVVRKYVNDRVKPDIGQWFEAGELPAKELDASGRDPHL